MKRADLLIAGLALTVGLALGACFGTPCLEESTLDYSLRDGSWTTATSSARVGAYVSDDPVDVEVDTRAQTITMRFTEDDVPVVVVYDVTGITLPE